MDAAAKRRRPVLPSAAGSDADRLDPGGRVVGDLSVPPRDKDRDQRASGHRAGRPRGEPVGQHHERPWPYPVGPEHLDRRTKVRPPAPEQLELRRPP